MPTQCSSKPHTLLGLPVALDLGVERIQMTTKALKKSQNQPAEISVGLQEGFFEIKELTLANHIEALQRIANDDESFLNLNRNNNSNTSNGTTCLPILLNPHSNNSMKTNKDLPQNQMKLLNKASDHAWTTDPALLPGNLRNETMFGNLAMEEVISRCSSKSDQTNNESITATAKVLIKGRRKSLKSGKRKSGKKKGSSSLTPVSVFPNVSKDSNGTSLSTQKVDCLSAFCSSVVIHSKSCEAKPKKTTENSRAKILNKNGINSKTPYAGSSQKQYNNNSLKQCNTIIKPSKEEKQSLVNTSLTNAISEYSHRLIASQSQGLTLQDKKKLTSGAKVESSSNPRKIYLSEKQSGVITEAGTVYPCAPPATPTAEQARKYNYVPCLHDVRAQRSFRQRLQYIENKISKKEKKKEEDNLKLEFIYQKERKAEQKRRQRQEIYALNKEMTDLELDRFNKFMSSTAENI